MLPDEAAAKKVYRLLCRMGVTANCNGFYHTAYAVLLAMENPQRLLMVTKWLYPEVAQHYHTTWSAVERSIRTVITIIWNTCPELLSEIAGCPLPKKPGPSQFISMLSVYLYSGSDI